MVEELQLLATFPKSTYPSIKKTSSEGHETSYLKVC